MNSTRPESVALFWIVAWVVALVLGVGIPVVTAYGPFAAGKPLLGLLELFHGFVAGAIVLVWMYALFHFAGEARTGAEGGRSDETPGERKAA